MMATVKMNCHIRPRGVLKQVSQPVSGNTEHGPIGEFRMDGRLYLVLPDTRKTGRGLDPTDGSGKAAKADIAGELEIGRERYVVVRPEKGDRKELDREAVLPPDILTRRELQIVTLVADGRVNKQIAIQLKISEWTVSTHLRRIFAKLGVDSRAAMVYKCSTFI